MTKLKNEVFKLIDKGQWCECEMTIILREFPNIISIYLHFNFYVKYNAVSTLVVKLEKHN